MNNSIKLKLSKIQTTPTKINIYINDLYFGRVKCLVRFIEVQCVENILLFKLKLK